MQYVARFDGSELSVMLQFVQLAKEHGGNLMLGETKEFHWERTGTKPYVDVTVFVPDEAKESFSACYQAFGFKNYIPW